MFIGHFALAFAAKRPAPRASLGLLFAAAQLPDLVWPVLLLLGWEHVVISPGDTPVTPLAFVDYPWTHSLLAAGVWAVVAALLCRAWSHNRAASWVVGVLVLSHWLLDWVTHRPDLSLSPWGGTRVGLGLWRSLPATVTVELVLFALGLASYARTTRARNGVGRWGLVGLALFLLVVYWANLAGPPPPSVSAVAWGTMALWLLVLWAWWVDRHRELRAAAVD